MAAAVGLAHVPSTASAATAVMVTGLWQHALSARAAHLRTADWVERLTQAVDCKLLCCSRLHRYGLWRQVRLLDCAPFERAAPNVC